MTFETPMLFAIGFYLRVHHGRFHRADSCHCADRYSAPGHVLHRGPLPLLLVAGSLLPCSPASTTGARSGPADVQRSPRQDPFLVVADCVQRHFLPHALPGLAGMPRRYADYRCSSPISTWWFRGAFAFGFAQVYFFFFIVLPVMRGQARKRRRSLGKVLKGWNGGAIARAIPHFETPPSSMPRPTRSWLIVAGLETRHDA